jgi:hypothetical protein
MNRTGAAFTERKNSLELLNNLAGSRQEAQSEIIGNTGNNTI